MELVFVIAIAVLVIGILLAILIFVRFGSRSPSIIAYPTELSNVSAPSTFGVDTPPRSSTVSSQSVSQTPRIEPTPVSTDWGNASVTPQKPVVNTPPVVVAPLPSQEKAKVVVDEKTSPSDVSLKDFLRKKYVPLLEQQLQEKVEVLEITPDGANMIFKSLIAGEKVSLLVDQEGKIIDFKRIAG